MPPHADQRRWDPRASEARARGPRSRAGEAEHDRRRRAEPSWGAGAAEYPTDGETLEELLRAADVRLYQAKEGGRHSVVAG